jgi:hypothetical protein
MALATDNGRFLTVFARLRFAKTQQNPFFPGAHAAPVLNGENGGYSSPLLLGTALPSCGRPMAW